MRVFLIEWQKDTWFGHILSKNCHLKRDIEGKVKQREKWREEERRRNELLDDLNETRR